jgi:hypothetical protein
MKKLVVTLGIILIPLTVCGFKGKPPTFNPSAKQGTIYNSHGQLQQTWKIQPAGNKNTDFYNKHNQLEFSVKPDGTVLNKHNQRIGEIKTNK